MVTLMLAAATAVAVPPLSSTRTTTVTMIMLSAMPISPCQRSGKRPRLPLVFRRATAWR